MARLLQPAAIPAPGNAAILGDFNGDGKPDIAITGETSLNVSILLGKGDGTFSNAILTPLPSGALGFPGQIVSADFNGDGKLDLAVSLGSRASISGLKNVAILLGKGDGTFAAPYLTQDRYGSVGGCRLQWRQDPGSHRNREPAVTAPTPMEPYQYASVTGTARFSRTASFLARHRCLSPPISITTG